MKNLENYGVQEMNKQDIKDTEGGFIMLLAFAVAAGVVAYECYKHIPK
jgi:hypothetical protein